MHLRKPKLAICTTNYGPIESNVYQNHMSVAANASRVFDIPYIGCTDKTYTHTASNMLAVASAEMCCDYIMWLENDMILPFDAITRLYESMKKENKLICSGLYFLRGDGTRPCLFNRMPNEKYKFSPVLLFPENSTFQIDCPGMGCVLMNTDVFRKIDFPYFDLKESVYGQDIYFYSKVKDNGIDVLVDSSVACGHMGSREMITIDTYHKYITDIETRMPAGGTIITNPKNYVKDIKEA